MIEGSSPMVGRLCEEDELMKMRYALCAMVLSVASAVAFGQQVSVNYNHSQDFTQYKTYAWGSNNANQIQNSILAQQARSDVNQALQGKGLQMVQESQNPNLIVTENGGLKQQTSYTAMGMGRFGGGMGTISPEQSEIGTLIVDLYDAKNKNLVWRGISQDTLSTNGGKNAKTVQKAIQKMFKQYP
jgi:hypothetical protein